MRLRRVSHLVVSSVLASCGGGESQRVVTIPTASASATSAPLPPTEVMDVVPTDPNARMRFVSLAEIVGALVPPDPNRVALYAVDPNANKLQRVQGPSVEDACSKGPLATFCGNFGSSRWIALKKDGTVTRGTFDDLDRTRTHDPTITRALAESSKVAASGGVWFIDGEAKPFPIERALGEDTAVAPPEDAMLGMVRVSSHAARLRSLHGDERERAVLALRLPQMDRAVLRVLLATSVESVSLRARAMPLARGWLFETITLERGGGCGSSTGVMRVVVLGSEVIVDLDRRPYPRPCKGRRPPDWKFNASRASSSIARFLEDAASAEAASVDAFDLVARELASFGAPREIVDRARAAALDEARHAAIMAHLAGASRSDAPRTLAIRTPFEAALDNAVEGCVNESFAAVVARFQSRTARDERLARELAAIADDECRHGDLAHDIAAWLEPRLTPSERERICSAREAAKRLLVARAFEVAGGIDDDAIAHEALGLPTREQATALATAFVAF